MMKTILRITASPGRNIFWAVADEGGNTFRPIGGRGDETYQAGRLDVIRSATEWAWAHASGRIPGYVRKAALGDGQA